MSLRLKFLGLLVVVPSFCLGIFLYFATTSFVSDKTTSLFESQFQLLNSASLVFLQVENDPEAFKSRVALLLKQEGFENLQILDGQGNIRFSSDEELIGKSIKELLGTSILEKLSNQKTSEGSFEASDPLGKTHLVSFLRFPINKETLIFVLYSIKSGVTRASLIFLYKSLSAFVALVSLAVFISLIFSNKLTSGIRMLSQAMVAFGRGNSDSQLPAVSDDEIGQMTTQFGLMRSQIGGLLVEKESKARIETEMRLAGDLQRRFFPVDNYQSDNVDLAAYFEPTHDAGGDWWFYFEKNEKLIFVIGDVTGHGLNSAMITGVSRSAFSLFEDDFKGTSQSMRLLNNAIYDASSGKMNMTCFMASLDLQTGLLTYTSASHDPPYILPSEEKNLKLKDMIFLEGKNGPRLGEKKNIIYPEHSFQFEKNQLIFVYTDGLTELKNKEGQMFGERKVVTAIGTGHSSNVTAQELINKVKDAAFKFRKTCDLNDDLSFMAIKWRKL